MKTKYIIISLSLIAFMSFWMIGGVLLNSGIHPMGILGIPLFIIQSFQDHEEIGESYKPGLEQLQRVFDYCNDDTSGIRRTIGLEYFNDTHYINNGICEWQVLKKYPNSDRFCIPGHDYSDEEIRNDTHIYNLDKCSWEEEFSWKKEWKEKVVSKTPLGFPRDTTGNYDHCFSYKTDPEYGVLIQNFTHILNPENCEWEKDPNLIQLGGG